MTGYHVTTPKKLARYEATGAILPPVRYWPNEDTARRWAKRTGREVVLAIDPGPRNYPLPDHRPARFTDEPVRAWEQLP